MSEMNDQWLEEVRGRIGPAGARQKDNHHLLHDAKSWLLHPEGEFIRSHIIARGLNRAVHNLIHEETAPVPVPQYYTLQHVANRLTIGLPVLYAADEYCSLVEQSNKSPKAKPLEIKLNNLSIEGIRAQLDYVRFGMGREL